MRTDGIWPACIVTVFDLIGTRKLATTGQGSSMMIQMHAFAKARINNGLPNHDHAYIWNDSVLLLSYKAEEVADRIAVVDELVEFKRALDAQCGNTYAISVRGLAFPAGELTSPVFDGQIAGQSRAVVLKTSSWAMANCFRIEEKLGRHRADWYIDSRITRNLKLPKPFASEQLALLPGGEARKIQMYRGYLANAGE